MGQAGWVRDRSSRAHVEEGGAPRSFSGTSAGPWLWPTPGRECRSRPTRFSGAISEPGRAQAWLVGRESTGAGVRRGSGRALAQIQVGFGREALQVRFRLLLSFPATGALVPMPIVEVHVDSSHAAYEAYITL